MESSSKERAEQLFLQALGEPAERRRAFVEAAARDEGPAVASRVRSMLEAHDSAVTQEMGGSPTRASAAVVLEPGAQLDRFEIKEVMGRGGMGEVYRAHDAQLERDVALKILPPTLAESSIRVGRFIAEARALAAIRHPGVVTVHSVEEHDGLHFLTMDLVAGSNLARLIPEAGMQLDLWFDLALQLTEAVAAAHEVGIVHRDLKPSNVLVNRALELTLIDFGLVKRDPLTAVSRAATPKTQTGTIMGTVQYMSPEQARGKAVDARSDVFSLGSVLYEMACGRRAFEAESTADTIASILRESPESLASLRPELPEQAVAVVERCLEKEPGQRFASAREVADALTQSRTGTLARRSRRRISAVLVAASLLIAALGWWWSRDAEQQRWARTEGVPGVLQLVEEGNLEQAALLAQRVEDVVGRDPALDRAWPRLSSPFEITTEPDGAAVSVRPYTASSDDWRHLGTTPLRDERFPVGAYRLRILKEGYEPIELARSLIPATMIDEFRNSGFDYLEDSTYKVDVRLDPVDTLPEGMIRVSGGLVGTTVFAGFSQFEPKVIPSFLLDRMEVTNAEFAEFVGSDGYSDLRWWSVGSGDPPLAAELIEQRFVDSTGRPGPAGWVLGAPEAGSDALPVGGVSWFEADAYCRWAGKSLPTLYHWSRAALPTVDVWIPFNSRLAAASNFGGEGPRPGVESTGWGASGALDVAGNVREWVATGSPQGKYLLGGAWSDPVYRMYESETTSPWQREVTDGLRCARFEGELPAALTRSTELPDQSFRRVQLPDGAFEALNSFYRYPSDKPLAVTLDSAEVHAWGAEERWVSLDAAYPERLHLRIHAPTGPQERRSSEDAAALFELDPADGSLRPVIVYVGGGNVIRSKEMEELLPPFDAVVRAGTVFITPVLFGTFQRNDGRILQRIAEDRANVLKRWVQDLNRTIDYIERSPGLDSERIVFLGLSLGAGMAPELLPFTPRFAGGALISGGFSMRSPQERLDYRIGLLGRVDMPIVQLGGLNDFTTPEAYQRRMFEFFGTAEEDKRLVFYPSGHWPLPATDLLREIVDFVDRTG